METTENPPSEWWQKAQIGAEMTPILLCFKHLEAALDDASIAG